MGMVGRARVTGPLAPFAEGYRMELERLGYTASSREFKVYEMARLSRWLEKAGHSSPATPAPARRRSWQVGRRAANGGRR